VLGAGRQFPVHCRPGDDCPGRGDVPRVQEIHRARWRGRGAGV